MPAMSAGVRDLLLRLQADLPRAEERRSEDLHLELVLGHLLPFRAEIAREERVQVVRVAEQVGRRQDRPGRNLLRDVLRRDVAHLEVVALQRDELGALLEQVAAVERLERVVRFDILREHLDHVRADVLVREHCREAQRRLGLRPGGNDLRSRQRDTRLECGTSVDLECHDFLLVDDECNYRANHPAPDHFRSQTQGTSSWRPSSVRMAPTGTGWVTLNIGISRTPAQPRAIRPASRCRSRRIRDTRGSFRTACRCRPGSGSHGSVPPRAAA